jgi:outer membrane receptor for ferrienterochelin and colicins
MSVAGFSQCFRAGFDERGAFGKSKRLPHLILIYLLLWRLLLPQPAAAQPQLPQGESPVTDEALLFQEIPTVSGASRYEQSISEAPAFVSIVTAREIKLFGYRTLADILRSVAGFYTTYDRNYSYLGVRGFGKLGDYSTRVLLLIDGTHRLNDSVYYQAPIGNDFPVDVDLIDRVEIIRGPSSSIYGTNAVFAVINVITKRGRDLKGVELSGAAGSFDTYKGRLSYGDRFSNGLEALASGSYSDSKGQDLYFKQFDRPSTNHGVAQNLDGDRYGNFFTKLGFKDLTLSGAVHSSEKQIPTAPWDLIFNDPRSKTIDGRAFMDLKYEGNFENQLGLMVRTYYDRYEYEGDYPYYQQGARPFLSSVLNKDEAVGEWFGGEFQVTKSLWEQHKVVLGAEYRFNSREDQRNYNVEPRLVTMEKNHSSSTTAVYAQDEFRITQYLILNAGVRYDYFEGFGDTVNPRLGLVYHPFEPTSLKLLYGQAFRVPNAYELYSEDGTTTKANPSLQPETIRTYEVVWEQLLGKHLRFTLAGFYYDMDNLISLQTDPVDNMLFFSNIQQVTAKGFEAELDAKWPLGIETKISYAFQHTQDQKTDQQLTNSPIHQAKFHALLPIVSDKLFFGTELLYTSPRTTLNGRETDDAYLLNLTLFWAKALKGLDLSCTLYNVLDQKFGEPGSEEHKQDIILQDGISFRVKATYSF